MAKSSKKVLVLTLIAGLIGLVGTLEYQRQTISAQLGEVNQQMKDGQLADQQAENQRLADQIITEVRALIEIPADIEPTVATIVDVETLRARNPFYNKAENGDHLVVTRERAILYSSSDKKIIDVVPVQLEPAEPAPTQAPVE